MRGRTRTLSPWLRTGFAATLLALSFAAMGASPASAVGETLTLDPAFGVPGDSIEVSGLGWRPENGEVRVFSDEAQSSDAANAIARAVPNVDGFFDTKLIVPELSAGDYTFFACQICDGIKVPDFPRQTVLFTVNSGVEEPSVALSQPGGAPGDIISVTGTGWVSGDDVFVFASRAGSADPTAAILTATPLDTGAFTTDMTVPRIDADDYEFYACQFCGDVESELSYAFPFTVTAVVVRVPTLFIAPTEGPVGEQLTATGSGWEQNAGPVSIFPDQALSGDSSKVLAAPLPGPAGGISATFTLPPSVARGAHSFYACQTCGGAGTPPSATAPFTVTAVAVNPPTVLVDPVSGGVGDTVTISGAGWDSASGPINVFLDESMKSGTPLVTVGAEPSGGFTATFTVPDADPADYQLYACQACGLDGEVAAVAAFTITGGSGLAWWIPVAGLALLVVVVGGVATTTWRRRRVRPGKRPRLVARPVPDFEVSAPTGQRRLPTLRLVPHDDEPFNPDRVEVRRW